MREEPLFAPLSEPGHAQNDFYSQAFPRILKFMLLFGLASLAVLYVRFGRAAALGFLVGALISGLNLFWQKEVVSTLADGMTQVLKRGSARGVVFRFVARYALIAAIAYAIFSSPAINIYGFLGGLFLPVAALFGEAFFELYVAMRHGT